MDNEGLDITRFISTEDDIVLTVPTKNGGHGSGNFKHAGRAGVVGGSGSGGGVVEFGYNEDSTKVREYIQKTYPTEFPDNELGSIFDYTGGTYLAINDTLRHGRVESSDLRHQKLVERIDNLKAASKRTALKQDTVLFRGSAFTDPLQKGQIVEDKGFGSTSLQPEVAEQFTSSVDNARLEYKYVMKIKAKKGTHGIFPATANVGGAENEFILQPNSKYQVTKVTPPDTANYEQYGTIEAELL